LTRNWEQLLLISAALKTRLLQNVYEKKQTAKELASANDYDLRATEIVMEALCELGLVACYQSQYEIKPAAYPLVKKDHPDYQANGILHAARRIGNWARLDKAISTGKSQTSKREPEELTAFIGAMDEFSQSIAPQVVSAALKELPEAKTALDLGGAMGTYAKLFSEKGLGVTLMDTPAVIEIAKKELSGSDINLVAGDFTESLPKGLFDIILLSNIAHIYKPEKNAHLLKLVSESLAENGLALIIDWVKGKSTGAAMFAVNMLIHTAGGGTWTLEQFRSWIEQAGLKFKSVRDLADADQKLLIAKKN